MGNKFIRLDYTNKEIFNKMMKDILSVWDNHCIYICRPNHLLRETLNLNDSNSINWDNTDIEDIFRTCNYKAFLNYHSEEAFRYVHSQLRFDIVNLAKEVSYLIVIEKNTVDTFENYFIRSIIRGDDKGYSILFNPEYENSIPSDLIESLLMVDSEDNNLSEEYKKMKKIIK